MQIADMLALGGHLLLISAPIVIVGGMERLMHVAYEVQEKLERDDLFLRVVAELPSSLANSWTLSTTIVGWSGRSRLS
jgi:hypothetical protein